MIPGIDPKVDIAFKKVYGGEVSQQLLPSLIDAVRQRVSTHHITKVQVLNPFTEGMVLDEKLSVLDIKARDDSGNWYDVEMQMLATAELLPRLLYYWSKVYAQQLSEGDSYRLLRPAISICFLNDIVFDARPADYHSIFKLWNEDGQLCMSDDLEIHILELPKFTRPLSELRTPLDIWLYFLKYGQELDIDRLPQPLGNPEIQLAMGVLKKMSQNTLEKWIYEGRMKMQRDQLTMQENLDEARQKLDKLTQDYDRMAQKLDAVTQAHDAAAQERDAAAQERDAAAQERDAAAQERERLRQQQERLMLERNAAALERERATRDTIALQKLLDDQREASRKLQEVARIQLCEQLLQLTPTAPESLLALSLDSLRQLSEELKQRVANR